MANKKATIAYVVTVMVMIFQIVDVFFIHPEDSIFGGNIVARLAGIVVCIISSMILKFNIKNFCFRSYGFVFEIIIGALYAIVPAAICFGAEYCYFMLRGSENLSLNITFPNINDSMELKIKLIAIASYVFTVLLQSVFKELFFRGFLITQLSDKYKIRNAVIIQSVLYMLLLIPTIVQSLVTGQFDGFGFKMTLYIIAGNLFIDLVSGFKWGLYYRVNGTVWMSISDHFVNNMIVTCVSITSVALPMKWFVFQAVAIQLISLLMYLPLYFKRDRQNEEIAAEIAYRREIAGLTIDNYSPSSVRLYFDNKRFERQTEYAKRRNMPLPQRDGFRTEYEEPVSLSDVELKPTEKVFETIDVFEEKKSNVEQNYSSADEVISSPSEMSKQFFEDSFEKSTEINTEEEAEQQNTDDNSENGNNNISQLVQTFFEDNFNKYIFEQKRNDR